MRTPRLQSILLAAVILGVSSVVLYNTRDILFGAPLTIRSISDGMTLGDSYLTIAGTARHARSLTVNGRSIYTNRKGEFSEPVLLVPGYNILEVAMTDRFGNQNVKQYELVLTETSTDRYTLQSALLPPVQ